MGPVQVKGNLGSCRTVEANPMTEDIASISTWLERVKEGDEDAAARLWERYFRRLLGLARARLVALRRQAAADEEDVVLSAFNDFFGAVRADKYADLHGRNDLWRVLATFVANKAKTLLDREAAAKRGGGLVQGESALGQPDGGPAGRQGLDGMESREPDPTLTVEVEERFQRFFAGLSDQDAEIASLRMEGHGTEEIAARSKLSPATVRRRLAVIRDVLAAEFGDGPAATPHGT
jgi:DNA-directed RNA polymerase specialized sigma24 family protein